MKKIGTTLVFLTLSQLFICSLPTRAYAQTTGRIIGTIVDVETDEVLVGVNITLINTSMGTASDPHGQFEMDQVPVGSYTLTASLLGYTTLQESISVRANVPLSLTLKMVPHTLFLGELLSQADRPYSAASFRSVRAFDLLTRPMRSAQDLLQLTPGLITAQHAGGGKAEQIFLRGFDADHGTDVNISFDGMPVNMVSHGHGQGYADLHFVIPDVVTQMEVSKGPYTTDVGNLATAGSIAFTSRDHIEENLIRVQAGSFNTASVTTLYQIPLSTAHQGAYIAGQFFNTDGPVESPQNFQRFNLFGKFHAHLSEETELALSVSGFSSAWDASGQIPVRAIGQNFVNRFGSIDNLEGGTTSRQNINLIYRARSGNRNFKLQGYASRYNFKLFSNFTFFLQDPVNGDMIEQTDDREILGFNGQYRFSEPFAWGLSTTSLGGGFRSDDIAVGLWKSPNRVRLAPQVDSDIIERNLYLWAQEELILSPKVRLQMGLRGDYFIYNVEDHLDGQTADLPHASGYAQQTILSPKASLVISPTSDLNLFINAGTGFHSNDARNVIFDQRVSDLVKTFGHEGLSDDEINRRLMGFNFDPSHRTTGTLPRAVGGEVGFRTLIKHRLNVATAVWLLDLDREFVYVGDGGYTELSDRSRRYGIDLEARLILTNWLTADADLNLAKGYFPDAPDDANEIPLAPRLTSTGGLTLRHPNGLEGSLRYVHVSDRPANEDGSVTAQGFSLINALAAYRVHSVKINLILENLFGVDWNEAQFDTESRLRGETVPVSELHFTPGYPRSLRVGLSYMF
jgi:hypothetical protein